MKRSAVLLLVLFVIAATILSAATPASSAMQPPPTNTKRPVSPTSPLTNTPRIVASPTLVRTPTLAATATRTPRPSKTPTLTPTITPTTIGPLSYPENINPLTGLPYPNAEAKNRRNMIVKVSNYTWIVRPQSGLSQADIVYEYEVEGAVTRFAAIYRSQGSDHVGSIRSGRLLDLELMVMYQGILAYSGSNDNIRSMILQGYCMNTETGSLSPCGAPGLKEMGKGLRGQTLTPQFGDNCPPFCRYPRPGLPFEHTLFGNTFQMWDLAAKRNINNPYEAKGFAFADQPDQATKTANDIFIKWYGDQDARWQYNPADHKYYRWNTGLPHIDANNGKQLSADNLIILQTYHKNRPDIYESETGSPAVEVQLWGQEKAWVFRDGNWYEGTWVRRNRERGGLQLMSKDGKTPMHLKPGNSWVEIVRCCNMSGVTASDQLVNAQGTETPAAMTATAHAPKYPASALTQTAALAEQTNAASAATAGITLPTQPAGQTTTPSLTPAPVGMLPNLSDHQ
jgi:hypothetical protein